MNGLAPGAKARIRLCRTLALIWCLPSLGAAAILATGAGRAGLRLEDWIAIAILAAHLLWMLPLCRWRRR